MMNKFYIKIILVVFLIGLSFASWAQIINTIAGNGIGGFSGDTGPANAAEINYPLNVSVDALGNVYIADHDNNRIRIINTSGIISTIAGTGVLGYSGDGGPATAAELNIPDDAKSDALGNIYIADLGNYRIRIINTSGIINTFAGNGIRSYSGDGGPAIAAELIGPCSLATDGSGNVYIADGLNNRIRIVNSSGIINTFAGDSAIGYYGDGGPATSAELNDPVGVATDAFGDVYISDQLKSRIRIVNTSGIINTFAGNGTFGFLGDGGAATAAELDGPEGITIDASGNVYIADYSNGRIRFVNTSDTIKTIAGDGYFGFSGDGGAATAAELNGPTGIAVNTFGYIYISDLKNNRIRQMGSVTGVNTISSTYNQITIYPIPTTGSYIITGVSQGQTIELYNCTGEKLSSTIATNETVQMDVSNSANGIYFIRIMNKDGTVVSTKKIVKTE